MIYGVVWKFVRGNGQILKLVAHPESLEGFDTPEKAMEEGRKVLADLDPPMKKAMTPMSVVELNPQMLDSLDKCPLVDEIGDEMMFVDVGKLDYWIAQSWWHV